MHSASAKGTVVSGLRAGKICSSHEVQIILNKKADKKGYLLSVTRLESPMGTLKIHGMRMTWTAQAR